MQWQDIIFSDKGDCVEKAVSLHFGIEKNYPTICRVRKAGRWASREKRELCDELCELIWHYGEETIFDGWELRYVMAYIFLVNRPFHDFGPGSIWEVLKRKAQDWVWSNHPCCIVFVQQGKYAGCYQATHGEWMTHWPDEELMALWNFGDDDRDTSRGESSGGRRQFIPS